MIIVIADTSGLLAALDSTHPEHRGANEAIMAAGLHAKGRPRPLLRYRLRLGGLALQQLTAWLREPLRRIDRTGFGFHIEDTAATSEALVAAGTPKPDECFTDRPFAEYRAMDAEGNWFDLSEHGFGGPRPSSDATGS
ncbi:hypothetical protein [Streptomyces sp. NPDC017958]|uniref:hypothetical protein n=1 Tax=Streptomyces sp. NPDC017958 TaxID=3365021 RepID=UPI0037A68AEB